MTAGGMTAHDERPSELAQLPRRRTHLADDLGDGDRGTQVVTRHRDVDAMGIEPAGEMAEERTIERLPIAAMDEDDDRTRAIAGKQIDPVAFARTVGDHLATGLMRLAIGCASRDQPAMIAGFSGTRARLLYSVS